MTEVRWERMFPVQQTENALLDEVVGIYLHV